VLSPVVGAAAAVFELQMSSKYVKAHSDKLASKTPLSSFLNVTFNQST
jgi:hypothetical protein